LSSGCGSKLILVVELDAGLELGYRGELLRESLSLRGDADGGERCADTGERYSNRG
jgi:hypothetical protein